MSIGGNGNSERPENFLEKKREIPLSWFFGVRGLDGRIFRIVFSDEFAALAEGELKTHMEHYAQHMNGRKSSSEIDNIGYRSKVQQAEKRVLEITGFSPKELIGKRDELNRQYKGKLEAAQGIKVEES